MVALNSGAGMDPRAGNEFWLQAPFVNLNNIILAFPTITELKGLAFQGLSTVSLMEETNDEFNIHDNAYERTVTLQIDEGAGELQSITNEGQMKHRAIITSRELSECQVKGKLEGVHYGSYNGKSAALIVFAFTFHFKSPRRIFRYTSASVKIKFTSPKRLEGESTGNLPPIIRTYFPEQLYGNLSSDRQEWKWNVRLMPSVASIGAFSVGVGNKTTVEHKYSAKIHGVISGEPNQTNRNVVRWNLMENESEKSGVPHRFNCATIVEFDRAQGEFQAEVTITVSTALKVGPFDPRAWMLMGNLWTKDHPVIFDWTSVPDSSEIQSYPELRGMDLSSLSEEQAQQLTPVPREYQVSTRKIVELISRVTGLDEVSSLQDVHLLIERLIEENAMAALLRIFKHRCGT